MDDAIDQHLLEEMREVARGHGLLELGAVNLDDPGFEPARASLAAYLERGAEGEMSFMSRSGALRAHPEDLLEGAQSLLVALVPYRGHEGAVARYAQSSDYHTEIHRRLERVAEALRAARPAVRTRVCVDTKPVLERSAAVLAGLGFIGKHGCVIAPGLGSYVLLGELLTTLRVQLDSPARPHAELLWEACGACTRCLDACPTKAFDAPGRLDPRKCISYLTIEHRSPVEERFLDAMGARVAGCDVCQEVCPYNKSESRAARVPEVSWLPPPRRVAPGWSPAETVPLHRLATLENSRHRAWVRGTPLARIPRRALRRNALIALGNVEGPLSTEERAALDRVAGGDDEELRTLAARAVKKRSRMGCDGRIPVRGERRPKADRPGRGPASGFAGAGEGLRSPSIQNQSGTAPGFEPGETRIELPVLLDYGTIR